MAVAPSELRISLMNLIMVFAPWFQVLGRDRPDLRSTGQDAKVLRRKVLGKGYARRLPTD
jgi:hypothetical protein